MRDAKTIQDTAQSVIVIVMEIVRLINLSTGAAHPARGKGQKMADKWKSIGLYEHPAKHQAGVFGNVALSPAGIYVLKVGGSHMSCPQEWAAKIHHEEGGENKIIHVNVNKEDHKYFAIACKRQVLTIADVIRRFVRDYGQAERERGDS